MMNRFEDFTTRIVQQVGKKEGPISPVMVNSASFGYGDSETGEGIFEGSIKKPLYARVGYPTSAQLEQILAGQIVPLNSVRHFVKREGSARW